MTEDTSGEASVVNNHLPQPLEPISKDFRTGMAVATVVGCGVGIALLNVYGSPENGIHTTSLTGFFFMAPLVLAGMGIGAYSTEYFDIMKRRMGL